MGTPTLEIRTPKRADAKRLAIHTPERVETVEVNGQVWVPQTALDHVTAEVHRLNKALSEIRTVVLANGNELHDAMRCSSTPRPSSPRCTFSTGHAGDHSWA